MFKIGEYVVYKHDVCKLIEIKKQYFNNEDYYILESTLDKSLKISVPVSKNNFLRPIIVKEEVDQIIKKIPKIETIKSSDKLLEMEYKKLINTGTFEDLITIIKTTYLRNKKRVDDNKKISDKDNNYFLLAEKYLYNEFSIVLGKSIEETKDYIIDKVEKNSK